MIKVLMNDTNYSSVFVRSHALKAVRKPGGGDSVVQTIPIPFGSMSKFYDITATPSSCQRRQWDLFRVSRLSNFRCDAYSASLVTVASVCQTSNGGCEAYQVCVPNPFSGGRSCMCSDEPRNGDPVCRDAL